MLLQNWPIKFSGTIKRISKEQAKTMFNYDLPADAKGIVFRVFESGNYISPYYPERHTSNPGDIGNRLRMKPVFSILSKITPQITHTIIRPIWNQQADKYNLYSGYHLFMKINSKLLLKGLEYLQLSIGDQKPPRISSIKCQNNTISLSTPSTLSKPSKLTLVLLDTQTLKITLIKPETYQKKIEIKTNVKNSIIFAYSKNGNSYSNSIHIKIKPINTSGLVCHSDAERSEEEESI